MLEKLQPKSIKLKQREKAYLKKLGLSKRAVELYGCLLREGPLSAKDAALLTSALPAAVYRLFYELESHELISRVPGRPRRFKALAISDGLQAALIKQEKQLKELIEPALTSNELASIIVGRQQAYHVYAHYAKQAQKDICIYSIGIAYNEELLAAQKAAIKRGVAVRQVVQEVRPSNFYVVDKWLRLGVSLRQLKRPRGYHLAIVDETCALVTFSDPIDTEQRISMLTTDKNTISIFRAQFESIWRSAKKII